MKASGTWYFRRYRTQRTKVVVINWYVVMCSNLAVECDGFRHAVDGFG